MAADFVGAEIGIDDPEIGERVVPILTQALDCAGEVGIVMAGSVEVV
jgi:hypothetical protein